MPPKSGKNKRAAGRPKSTKTPKVKVSLDHKLKRLKVSQLEVPDRLIYEFFNVKVSERDYEATLRNALHIGVMALMEDRISAFFTRTRDQLSNEMENLKLLYALERSAQDKATTKGASAEEDIAGFLKRYVADRNLTDTVLATGEKAGAIRKNKTGDIVCALGDQPDRKIVIEVKFNKSVTLGHIAQVDARAKARDTAWSQLLEAQANRDACVSIIVFDTHLLDASIRAAVDGVGYISGIGFVAVVDRDAGNFSNLAIAYTLARDIAASTRPVHPADHMLGYIIERLLGDFHSLQNIEAHARDINASVNRITEVVQKYQTSIQFNQNYLSRFLKNPDLSSAEVLNYYNRHGLGQPAAAMDSDTLESAESDLPDETD